MLYIFRKLRRLELRKKSGRYFLYAFGEIVLIVVGILIAVQFNKWQDRRQDEILKQQYLRTMVRELEADVETVASSKDNALERLESIRLLLDIANDPELARKHTVEFMIAVRSSGGIGNGPVTTSTYEELRSTGNFRLLDDELKRALNEFFRTDQRNRLSTVAQDLLNVEHLNLSQDIFTAEQDIWYQDQLGPVRGRRRQLALEELGKRSYDEDAMVEAAHRLAANDEFLEWLPIQRSRMLGTIGAHERRLELMDELLELINSQLED